LATRLSEKKPPPKGVKVTTNIPRDVPAVLIDPQQIEQVLGNLVTNAYQAMPEGGELNISAEAGKDHVHLSVSDSGCGISDENIAKLFEPLFTTKARGIGLGLAVSKRLAQANGGDIEVVSEEGKGTTFTVLLPVSRESAISPSA
jgi:signal transduction histidine kinase